MLKQTKGKLNLATETLRHLSETKLRLAAGAIGGWSDTCTQNYYTCACTADTLCHQASCDCQNKSNLRYGC